jgi:hypothetical protein
MSKKRKMGISNFKRFKLDLYNKFIFQMKLRLLGLPIKFSIEETSKKETPSSYLHLIPP